MSDHIQNGDSGTPVTEENAASGYDDRRRHGLAVKALILLLVFAIGAGSGYLVGSRIGHNSAANTTNTSGRVDLSMIMHQINPSEGFQIPAVFGDIGPKMVAAGAIDVVKFTKLYQQQNKPLTDEQMSILNKGSDTHVVIKPDNAYFLLNIFWALGLTNLNDILTEGSMVAGGNDKVGGFASTGGWTLGVKRATELYASIKIVRLTDEQQARLLEVASGVYRPCCDNPTDFPDCNHGMAMLGLLELMASQGASTAEMFEAAKFVTAFWYPQQMLEIASAFKAAKNVDYTNADARMVVSREFASISGFRAVHQWLGQNGLLEQAPSSGGSCGVQ